MNICISKVIGSGGGQAAGVKQGKLLRSSITAPCSFTGSPHIALCSFLGSRTLHYVAFRVPAHCIMSLSGFPHTALCTFSDSRTLHYVLFRVPAHCIMSLLGFPPDASRRVPAHCIISISGFPRPHHVTFRLSLVRLCIVSLSGFSPIRLGIIFLSDIVPPVPASRTYPAQSRPRLHQIKSLSGLVPPAPASRPFPA